MLVKGNQIRPVKKNDGTWDVESVPYEEEFEDLGREHLMCNICGFSGYPQCMSDCKAYLPNGGRDEKRAVN